MNNTVTQHLAAYPPEANEAQQRDFLTHSESMKYEGRMMEWSSLSGAFSSFIIQPPSLPPPPRRHQAGGPSMKDILIVNAAARVTVTTNHL